MASHTYIAIVDDDLSVCTSLSRLLRQAHFQPISYLSAEAFLADDKQPRFDCLVFDVLMGGMSGVELFARIAAAPSCPPVIFISARDEPAARARAEALGCAGFFSKLAPGAEIIETIRRAVRDEQRVGSPADVQARANG